MARNDPLSFRPDDDQKRRFTEFKENTGTSKNKALGRLVEAGLQDYGYEHGTTNAAQLKRGITEAAKGVTYSSLAVFGISAWTTLNLALVASLFLIGGMMLYQIAGSEIPNRIAGFLYGDNDPKADAKDEVATNAD